VRHDQGMLVRECPQGNGGKTRNLRQITVAKIR
jgi:hypothetical protein